MRRRRSSWTTSTTRRPGSPAIATPTASPTKAGAYVVKVKNDESGSWVWRVLGDSHPVLRAKGSVELSDGDGAGGYMCGAGDADPRGFIFGDVTSSAEWVMGTITGSTASVRARGPLPSGSDAVGPRSW